MLLKDITLDELLSHHSKNNLALIDVRSPSEFKEMTIPGSINIPLFDDQEHEEIGTLYKQVSPQAARERGLEITSAKLPTLVKKFNHIKGDRIVYCWRGGMRSKSIATTLDLMGIETFRLVGGIRSYRRWVLDQLDNFDFKPKAFVLNGGTGTGKTEILHKLHHEGYGVLDLEGLANHRGSVFGHIGLESNNQKTFETQFVSELQRLQSFPHVLFEAESKRIGKILIPELILNKKDQGIQLFIEMPIEERIRRILEEYRPWEYKEECLHSFDIIKKRIHTPIRKEIETDLHSGHFESAIRLLLEYYYDPRYSHTAKQYSEDQVIHIKVKHVEDALEKVSKVIKSHGYHLSNVSHEFKS